MDHLIQSIKLGYYSFFLQVQLGTYHSVVGYVFVVTEFGAFGVGKTDDT